MRRINGFMNYARRGWFVALALVSLVACTSEELDVVSLDKESVEVSLSISSRAGGEDAESQIKSLRVYAFEGKELVAHYENMNVTGASHQFKMILPLKHIVFYVIANEGAAGELKKENGNHFEFSESMQVSDFRPITFSSLPNDVDGQGIPMTAVYETTVQKDVPILIDNLTRSVAKLNIYAVKKGAARAFINRGIYLYNVPMYGYLFARKSTDPEPYKGRISCRENKYATEGEGPNQMDGQVILSADWKTDTGNPILTHEVTKLYNTQADMVPGNYDKLTESPVYLFPNPNDDAKIKTSTYMVKICWTEVFSKDGRDEVSNLGASTAFLPVVDANDNIQFFAHMSVTNQLKILFNWMIAPWTSAGGDVAFN